ncbi:MAG: cyanophycinase [Planctomycetota bacterium]
MIRSNWRRMLIRTALGLLLCVGATPADAGAESLEAGQLVIVGGRLSPGHEAVYRAVLDAAIDDGRVGVIPLASGVPERSGPLTVQDFQQYAADNGRVFDTELTNNAPEYAGTRECAKKLAACGGLWFTGGNQNRITAAMRPASGDTPSYQAVLGLLKRGGVVGGTSAGAAMMSDSMITGGTSRDAMLLGANPGIDVPGVGYAPGMGYFHYGLVDQHFLRRGRFGRLMVATTELGLDYGFGVSENRAMHVDLSQDRVTVIGDEGLTFLDLSDAEHADHGWSNARVSILSDGDVLDPTTGAVEAASARKPLSHPGVAGVPGVTFPNMWDPHVVGLMVRVLAMNPAQPVSATDGAFDYWMSADEQTRFYGGAGAEDASLTAVGVRLDVMPRDGLDERIADRRAELAAVDTDD